MIEFHSAVKLIDYPEYLIKLQLDVGIAPLLDNAFNQAKSNLKLLEYGAMFLPVLASNLPCYSNSPATLLANETDVWFKQLQQLHTNPQLIEEQGEKMHKWLNQAYWLEDHLDEWFNALGLKNLKI